MQKRSSVMTGTIAHKGFQCECRTTENVFCWQLENKAMTNSTFSSRKIIAALCSTQWTNCNIVVCI